MRKHKPILILLIFAILVITGFYLVKSQKDENVTIRQLYDDGTLSLWGLDGSITTETCPKILGLSYEEYAEKLISAYDSDDYDAIAFSFEGKKAVLVPSFNNGVLRVLTIEIIDPEQDAAVWKDYSDHITEQLRALADSEVNSSHFVFKNAEIDLEYFPVDSSEITVNDDGTTSWTGVIGEYGTKISEIRISFQ